MKSGVLCAPHAQKIPTIASRESTRRIPKTGRAPREGVAVLDCGVAVTVAVRVAFRPLAPTNDGAEGDSARAAPYVCALAGRGLSHGDGN